MNTLCITRPDDFHVHFRDGDYLRSTVPATARCFGRAVAMPNLKPPVTTCEAALAYRERLLRERPKGSDFQPLMTLYLTDQTTPTEIETAKTCQGVLGAKLYPAGATTHAEAGVTNVEMIFDVLEAMQEVGLPLMIHGETARDDIDPADRECDFIDRTLAKLVERFPDLRIVFEHASTQEAVEFVSETNNIAATITVHHLLLSRKDWLEHGTNPHYFCLPVLKDRRHQDALMRAATSGNPKFFFGSDSAPHLQTNKEGDPASAGIFSAPVAIELLAEIFEGADALDRLEAFTGFYGADFYGLPRHTDQIVLERKPWHVPERLPFGDGHVVPLWAGKKINWKMVI